MVQEYSRYAAFHIYMSYTIEYTYVDVDTIICQSRETAPVLRIPGPDGNLLASAVWCAPHCIISLVKVLQQKLILKAIPTFKQVFPCQPQDNNGLKHPLAKKYN